MAIQTSRRPELIDPVSWLLRLEELEMAVSRALVLASRRGEWASGLLELKKMCASLREEMAAGMPWDYQWRARISQLLERYVVGRLAAPRPPTERPTMDRRASTIQ